MNKCKISKIIKDNNKEPSKDVKIGNWFYFLSIFSMIINLMFIPLCAFFIYKYNNKPKQEDIANKSEEYEQRFIDIEEAIKSIRYEMQRKENENNNNNLEILLDSGNTTGLASIENKVNYLLNYVKEEKQKEAIIKYNERKSYLVSHGIKYDENNLKTFQDLVNYLIIHETGLKNSMCADKIYVKDYVKKMLGRDDLTAKIIKIYDDPEDINFDELPNKFVLKSNHGSHRNIFVTNKTTIDKRKTIKTLKQYLTEDYSPTEYVYRFIRKRVFAEEYLESLTDYDLREYRVYCFYGQPKVYYFRQTNREEITHYAFMDENFNYLDYSWYGRYMHKHCDEKLYKPRFPNLLKEYATKLSQGFKFVRVDFYELEDKIMFGEMTFTPSNSYVLLRTREMSKELAKHINFTYLTSKNDYY